MAVEPTAELDRPPVEEFEQKVEDEEESDEYDTEVRVALYPLRWFHVIPGVGRRRGRLWRCQPVQ